MGEDGWDQATEIVKACSYKTGVLRLETEPLLTLFPTVPNIKEGDVGRITIDPDSKEFIT